jgi:hypothetical protein
MMGDFLIVGFPHRALDEGIRHAEVENFRVTPSCQVKDG